MMSEEKQLTNLLDSPISKSDWEPKKDQIMINITQKQIEERDNNIILSWYQKHENGFMRHSLVFSYADYEYLVKTADYDPKRDMDRHYALLREYLLGKRDISRFIYRELKPKIVKSQEQP